MRQIWAWALRRRGRARAMILALRYTALRMGDVALLERDRVSRDGNRWRIFLRTEKSGKPVFLPIPSELKNALDAVPLPRGCGQNSRYYFWNEQSSELSMKSMVERTLAAVFKASMVPDAHAHQFRHTLATELLGNGASFEDVADILGNSLLSFGSITQSGPLLARPVSTISWNGFTQVRTGESAKTISGIFNRVWAVREKRD